MSSKFIIHNYLNFKAPSNSEFKKSLLENISNSEPKLGGFSLKKYLVQKIKAFVKSKKGEAIFSENESENVQKIVEQNLNKAMKILENKNTVHVYLIPTLNPFSIEKMDGIMGFCAAKNAIHLYIHPECNFQVHLIETLIHEYNHSVFYQYHQWKTVNEGLVAEGLAEHFRLELVGGKRAKWTEVFDKKESKVWLEKIKPILNSENQEDYNNVFTNFEKDPYPLWAGYTIGYYLIEEYRKQNKLSWDELMRLDAEILVDRVL
jgi:uncharacterized protein YjaZ